MTTNSARPDKHNPDANHQHNGAGQPGSRKRRGKRRGRTHRGAAPRRGSESAPNSEARAAARAAVTPRLEFPPELPVSGERGTIEEAIRANQVVIVAGETGSGKTTQLPKVLLDMGYGTGGMIGHTQPRRIAARAVAQRLADETQLQLGHGIGYQVRFTSETGESTRVKVMTDGILLAELRHDPQLRAYDAIIIDEAHERSLNIDFLLGFLARLLPQRPDLKLIITSATIDPESFSAHFADAPIIRVSGRTYPVEIRYRPLQAERREAALDDDDGEPGGASAARFPTEITQAEQTDQIDGIVAAFDELRGEAPGDILVFLSGEREIRDTAEALQAHLQRSGAPAQQWEVVPLFGRLSSGEQQKVFAAHSRPRIVLATNVAETSLTVPGIVYVIDAGTARISRYSNRTKVQRLPIERISQASARQRSGRTGRTGPGVAIRLYGEDDFASRPEYTDPEILRTNLASVILQMVALGFGRTEADIADFPFLTPPEPKAIRDGRALLAELGAIEVADGQLRLTKIGRTLAQIPIDPRLARMILAGVQYECAGEVAAIVAALSIQDPRERPQDHRDEADALHARFTDPRSDFLTLLRLWDWVSEQSAQLSSSKFRKKCKAEYINFVRVREWQDLVGQLRTMLGRAGVHVEAPRRLHDAQTSTQITTDAKNEGKQSNHKKQKSRAPYSQREADIHRALLTGLLSMFGVKTPDGHDYQGARGTRMRIFPGSALFKANPDVIVAAELVETSRLWARTVAEVKPEWIVDAAGTLIRHQYGEPHWSTKTASAMAYDRMSLYGVTLVGDHRVGYGKINPVEARELFIRHALIAGEWNATHDFLRHNARALREAEDMASRVRSRRLLAGDDVLFDFYDARLPETAVSGAHFESWWKKARQDDPHLLDISVDDLLADDAQTGGDALASDYPLEWKLPSGATAKLRYAFDPGSAADGVTVELSAAAALGVDPELFSWQVPGLRTELVTALIRSLPKPKRRYFVPAPDIAAQVMPQLRPYEGSLQAQLAEVLTARAGGGELRDLVPITITPADFDLTRLPPHLRLRFAIVAGKGRGRKTIARGDNLAALQKQLRAQEKNPQATGASHAAPQNSRRTKSDAPAQPASTSAKSRAPRFEAVTGLHNWTFGAIPGAISAGGRTLYPGLRDDGESVSLQAFDTAAAARAHTRVGAARLLALGSREALSYVSGRLDNKDRLLIGAQPSREKGADPLTDALMGAVLRAMGDAVPADDTEFANLRRQVNETIVADLETVFGILLRSWSSAAATSSVISRSSSLAVLANLTDVSEQLQRLVRPGVAADTDPRFLARIPVYLDAAAQRVQNMGGQAPRDRQLMDRVQRTAAEVRAAAVGALGDSAADLIDRRSVLLPAAWQDVLWDVEELRVSLFAPQLGTAHTVSEKRITKALAALRG